MTPWLQRTFKFTLLTRKGWPVAYENWQPFKNLLRTILVARGIYRGTRAEWDREHNARRREQIKNGVMECDDANFKGPQVAK